MDLERAVTGAPGRWYKEAESRPGRLRAKRIVRLILSVQDAVCLASLESGATGVGHGHGDEYVFATR